MSHRAQLITPFAVSPTSLRMLSHRSPGLPRRRAVCKVSSSSLVYPQCGIRMRWYSLADSGGGDGAGGGGTMEGLDRLPTMVAASVLLGVTSNATRVLAPLLLADLMSTSNVAPTVHRLSVASIGGRVVGALATGVAMHWGLQAATATQVRHVLLEHLSCLAA